MKPQEVRDLSADELRVREHDLVAELFHLRLRRATSQLPNPMKVRETKRNLARVKTVLRERGITTSPVSPAAEKAPAPRRTVKRARKAT